jgi:hypothetical protein
MSDHPGLGVMIGMLGGNRETVETIQSALGKEISDLSVRDNALHFKFADGTGMRVYDGGQSCCESRYMVCDDDLNYHVGAKLAKLELRSVDGPKDEYGEHEIQFLDVTTDRGVVQCANHNEHTGYYGGFWIEARAE